MLDKCLISDSILLEQRLKRAQTIIYFNRLTIAWSKIEVMTTLRAEARAIFFAQMHHWNTE